MNIVLFISYITNVYAVTDAELEALEQQIEQQEILDKEKAEAERKAKEEAKRLTEEKKRLEEERRKLEIEKKEIEVSRQIELEKEQERKNKFDQLISQANKAIETNNFELAKNNYLEALKIIPNEKNALEGINNVEKLVSICSSIIGEWGWKDTSQTMTFLAEGIVVHEAALNTVVKQNWKCEDPKNYKFLMIGQNGQSIEYYLSEDRTGLKGMDPWGNISLAKRKSEDTQFNKNVNTINICNELVGIWQWNNGAKSWFYKDGVVKTRAILIKSEGTWECIDPENRIFTFNTWNKKRKITMNDTHQTIESVGLLGEKLTGTRISDDPFETIPSPKETVKPKL